MKHGKKRLRMSIAALGLTAVLLAGGCGGNGDDGAASGTISLQYSTYMAPESALTSPVREWLEEIAKADDATTLEIEYFYQEALLGATDTIPGVRDGRADIGHSIALYHPAELPLSQIVGVPFATNDMAAQARAFNYLYDNNDAFRAEWDAFGVRVLSFAPNPGSYIGTNFPVNSLEDLRGRSLRAAGMLSSAVEAIGVNPVALAAPEIYESIERGVIDGHTSNPFEITVKLGFHEVAPYFTEPFTGLYNLVVIVMNPDVYESLPQSVKDYIVESRDDYIDRHAEAFLEADRAACDQLLAEGGHASVLPEAEVEKWKNLLGDSLYDEWRATAVASGLSEAEVDGFRSDYERALDTFASPSAQATSGLAECAARG